jgi:hypothetical protein
MASHKLDHQENFNIKKTVKKGIMRNIFRNEKISPERNKPIIITNRYGHNTGSQPEGYSLSPRNCRRSTPGRMVQVIQANPEKGFIKTRQIRHLK